MPFRAHLHTVNRHRRLVRHYCFKLGLVWQGQYQNSITESLRLQGI